MATENSLKINITANATLAYRTLNTLSTRIGGVKSELDTLTQSVDKATASFNQLSDASKALKELKSAAGGKNAFGLNDTLSAINSINKAMATLQTTGDKFGQKFGQSLKTGLKEALTEFKTKAGSVKIDVKTTGGAGGKKSGSKKQDDIYKDHTKALNRHAQALERYGFGDFIADHASSWGSKFFGEIAHLQEKRARVSAWNLSASQQKTWNRQVKQLLADNKLITEADAESMMMAAASSIGHYDPRIVGSTVARATRYAQMEKAMGYNKSEIDDIAKNYYGVAEARQVANDVEKTLKTFETVFRITTTSSGKITVADVETILRNLGPGAATLSDEGLLRLLAYAEQIKVAGRGQSGSTGAGISTVGTTTKMLQLMAMGKPSALGAKKMVAELGVMDDEVYRIVGDRVELALENVSKEAEKQNADERNFAKQIFERGDYNQILGEVVIGGNLARAGAFDKQLAQTDPVRWVQNLMPLIKNYTARSDKRASYYGQKGVEADRLGMTDEQFMATLSESDFLSAITSFWARTGLSQRVINAFSIFSNEAFQHRSAAMLQTAVNQKDVDALMLEQIQNGNLNLAFLRAEKAIDNLIQSFEPFGAMVGRITYQVSGFVDLLASWSKEWANLSKITAGWLTAKTIQSVISQTSRMYNLLGQTDTGGTGTTKGIKKRKTSKTGSSKDQPTNPELGGFAIFTNINNKIKNAGKTFTGVINKMKAGIATVGLAFTKVLSGIGWGLLLVDFATVLAQMAFEYTEWGKKFKGWIDGLAEYFANTEFSMKFKYGGDEYLTEEDKTRKKGIEQLRQEAQDANDALLEKDNWTRDDVLLYLNNQKNIKNWNQDLFDYNNLAPQTVAGVRGGLSELTKVLDAAGFSKIQEQLTQAETNLEAQTKRFDEFNRLYSASKGTAGTDEQFTKASKDYQSSIANVERAREAFDNVLNSDAVKAELTKIDKLIGNVKGKPIMAAIMSEVYDYLDRSFNIMPEQSASSLAYSGNNGTFSMFGQMTYQSQRANAQVIDSKTNLKKGVNTLPKNKRDQVPITAEPAVSSSAQAYLEKLNAQISKAGAASKQRYRFDTREELINQAKDQIISDVMNGKLMDFDTFKSHFLNEKASPNRSVYTRDDINWSRVEDGVSLPQLVEKQAQLLQLQKYNSTFGSLGIQSEDMRLESQRNLARAQASTTAVGEAGLPDQTLTTQMQEFKQLQAQLKASGVKNDQQTQALNDRRIAMMNQSFIAALQLQREYNDQSDDLWVNSLTQKQQLQWQFDRNSEVELAKYNSAMQTMEDAYTEWVVNNQDASEEERKQIQERYQRARANLTIQFNNSQIQKEQELFNKLHGIDQAGINQKIEDWQNLNDQIQSLQTEMMEGFVEANEKWLDGDENSWRDYFNNLLKMWRNMVLKQGYSQLLGGATKTISTGIGDFVAGAFGKELPTIKDPDDPNADEKTGIVQREGSGAYDLGKKIFGEFTEDDGMFSGITEKLKSAFTTSMDWFKDIFDSFDFSKFGSGLMDMFSGVGSWFSDLLSNIDFGSIGSAFSSMGSSVGSWASTAASWIGSFFADGGVMTSNGPLPLHTYANGGIARSAQVAVFGEGSTPEAYVPLPDGRSIPVTMNGGGGDIGGGNNISISINITNNQGDTTESQNSSGNESTNMKKLANNIKSIVKQEIVNQSRPGGLLYNSK